MTGISPISLEDMRRNKIWHNHARNSPSPAYLRGKTVVLPIPLLLHGIRFLSQLLVRRRRLDRGCGRGDGRMLSAGILIILPVAAAVIIAGASAAIPVITAAGIVTA